MSVESLVPLLRDPASGEELRLRDGRLVAAGGRAYPVVHGVPVLIADERSLFNVADYLGEQAPTMEERASSLARRLPNLSSPGKSHENYARLAQLVTADAAGRRARVLVVGGQIAGVGAEPLLDRDDVDVVETDVALGPRTKVVCDGHDLPFADGSFDAVIYQAVLEHVLDPVRCVEEARRVLRPGGYVYAETPFMQQVHGGAYDFTRFTPLGHRRLFRWFDEIAAGTQGGPATALGWSIQYLLLGMAGANRPARALARVVALLFFWLKYLDRWVENTPSGPDGAWGSYFLGRLRESPLDDRAIVRGFRGVPPRGMELPKAQPDPPMLAP